MKAYNKCRDWSKDFEKIKGLALASMSLESKCNVELGYLRVWGNETGELVLVDHVDAPVIQASNYQDE